MSLTDQRHVGPVFRQETGSGSGTVTSDKPVKAPISNQQQQRPQHTAEQRQQMQQQQIQM